jgi:hypothetical protein
MLGKALSLVEVGYWWLCLELAGEKWKGGKAEKGSW